MIELVNQLNQCHLGCVAATGTHLEDLRITAVAAPGEGALGAAT